MSLKRLLSKAVPRAEADQSIEHEIQAILASCDPFPSTYLAQLNALN
jgi:hypothetical protein